MGDKSPKAKNRQKKQNDNDKSQKAAATKGRAPQPVEVAKKTK